MPKKYKNIKTAIIYYCYNRPTHTSQSLSKIIEYKNDLPLYIFCDGSKNKGDRDIIEVQKLVKDFTLNDEQTKVIIREKNYGLAANVINGINDIFNKGFDAVIVLEDDCVAHDTFFNYMKEALIKYQNNPKVMHVSGFALPMNYNFKNDNYFTPYPCSWGWGTWKEEWLQCNFEDKEYYNKILKNPNMKKDFDKPGKSFSYFLKLQLQGEINSWLIRWYAHIFKNEGYSSWAVNTQLRNIGFDGTGEHKVNYDRFNQSKSNDKSKYRFESSYSLSPKVIREFRQHFMGPKLIDKIKTMVYLKTGIILEKLQKK